MESVLFTASIESDWKTLQEFWGTSGTKLRRCASYAAFLICAVVMIGYVLIMPKYRSLPYIAFLAASLFAYLRERKEYQKTLDSNGGKPLRNQYTITSDGIRAVNPVSGNTQTILHGEITGAWRSKHFLCLVLPEKQYRLIDLRSVNGGTPEELTAFVLSRCVGWKQNRIPRRLDLHIPKKMLIALAVVCLLCGFTGTGTDFTFGSDRTMSVREAYTALEELGISGITEDTVREIEAYEEEYGLDLNNYNPVPDLLYYAGAGEYDPEDWSWTPSRNGVYTFDMEAWEVSMMYTDFLNGVSAMSNGELIFSDIVEDNSRVDIESGTGTKYISFDFQGDRHRVSAEMMYDWMDMDALNSIAEVVNRSGGEKKLWFLFSESQCVSMFYRNEAWAEQFRDMTGYTLTTSIPYGY